MNSCKEKSEIKVHQNNNITGLASLIQLNPENTTTCLADYFNEVNKIDSVSTHPALKSNLSKDKKFVKLSVINKNLPNFSALEVWISGIPYAIPVKKSTKQKATFTFAPNGGIPEIVQIAGEMNGWNPANSPDFKLTNGKFVNTFFLNPGKYQYQYVIDGKWKLDPANPDSISNNIGGFNSLMEVKGNNRGEKPYLYTESNSKGSFSIGSTDKNVKIIAFWQNYLLPETFIKRENGKIKIPIPGAAEKIKRSFVRIWGYNDAGVSNDLLIPLENGKVIDNISQVNREDWEGAVLYFLMVDRFNNGNPDNDRTVDDPDILPKVNYFGGDIAGVTAKIKDGYFKDLGINTIWLSPIAQNPLGAYGQWQKPKTKFSGYHGYWPVSSSKVDFRLGSDDELNELIKTAHDNGFNVILDYVANHVHELHPVYLEHPDWATSLYLPDGTLNTEKWDEHRLTTWFDNHLPTLDLSKPEVVEAMTDSALYWMEKFGFDGFRHDATKHIPEVFWRTLTKMIKNKIVIPENKRIFQIGETYGSPELISSYVSTGMLDAQFDFNTYDRAVSVLVNKDDSFKSLSDALNESLQYYGYHNLMGYMTGNQDRARFISYASGDVSFDEDAKQAGWDRKIGVKDPVGYKKLSALIAFITTIPGVPTIYYGDEFGMPGANDPDNRRMMRFDELNKKEKENKGITKKLVNLRQNNLALIYGDYELLLAEKDILVYARHYFDKSVIVAFNKSNEIQEFSIELPKRLAHLSYDSNFYSEGKLEGNMMGMRLQPNSFDILTN